MKEGVPKAIYVRQVIEGVMGLKNKSVPVQGIVDNKGTPQRV